MAGIIFSYLAIKFFFLTSFASYIPFDNFIRAFWNSFPIDCMAIGGLYSILVFQKSKHLKYILRNDLFYSSIFLVILLMTIGFQIPYIHYEFYSIFFGIIITNFAVNGKINISLENNILNYLGNISYGLYMYHPIGIVLALYISLSYKINTNWFIYPLSLIFTIIFAGLSFKYFESYFLKFKKKFTVVISGIK